MNGNVGVEMQVKFASVIPDPCKAPSTSSKLALRPEVTATPNTAWSACKLALRDATTVMEFASVCAETSEAEAKSIQIKKPFRIIQIIRPVHSIPTWPAPSIPGASRESKSCEKFH